MNMLIHYSRIDKEKKAVKIMIKIYCDNFHNHGNDSLCDNCRDLLDYAIVRLDKCSFKDNKPVCAKCPIHCYKPEMRVRIRDVMRYSGRRMIFKHPMLAVSHIFSFLRRRRP